MKIYYKGTIFRFQGITSKLLYENITFKFLKYSTSVYRYLDIPDEIDLLRFLIECNCKDMKIYDSKINEIVNNYIKYDTYGFVNSDYKKIYSDYVNIIFEIVKDENGRSFAKEINTGFLFPLIGEEDVTITNLIHFQNVSYDNHGKHADADVFLRKTYTLDDDFYVRLKHLVLRNKIIPSNSNEIEEYKESFKKDISKKKKIFHKDDFNMQEFWEYVSKDNVYKGEIIIPEVIEKERKEKDKLTILMDNIELLLYKLGKINEKLKEEKQKEYDELLNSENKVLTTSYLSLAALEALESELEFIINHQKIVDGNIINYLESLLNEYNFGKTDITITEIDELYETFLKTKNNYVAPIQRKTLMNLSLLYIYEIYENKDSITLEDLEDSYFNDSLKTIAINIAEMIDNGTVEPFFIDLDNITPQYIFDVIINLKIVKDKDKIKKFDDK